MNPWRYLLMAARRCAAEGRLPRFKRRYLSGRFIGLPPKVAAWHALNEWQWDAETLAEYDRIIDEVEGLR